MPQRTLPSMPQTVLVWNGPAAEEALIKEAIDIRATLPAIFDLHPETIRRWFLPPGHRLLVEPPGWAQSAVATFAKVPLIELYRPASLLRHPDTKRWRVGAEVPQLV